MRNMERYRLQRHRPWSTFYLIETWNCHLVVIFENKHHGTNDSSDPSCRWIYKMSKKDDEEHLGSSSWTRVFDSRDRCGGVVGDDCKMCIKDSEVLKKWKNLTMDEWWNGCSFDESCNKSFGWFFWRSHSWLLEFEPCHRLSEAHWRLTGRGKEVRIANDWFPKSHDCLFLVPLRRVAVMIFRIFLDSILRVTNVALPGRFGRRFSFPSSMGGMNGTLEDIYKHVPPRF